MTVLAGHEGVTVSEYVKTEVPAYSDNLGTWEKCHCNQIVTVTRGSLVTNQSFGTCQKCHCKRGVTENSVTVSGEICILTSGTAAILVSQPVQTDETTLDMHFPTFVVPKTPCLSRREDKLGFARTALASASIEKIDWEKSLLIPPRQAL